MVRILTINTKYIFVVTKYIHNHKNFCICRDINTMEFIFEDDYHCVMTRHMGTINYENKTSNIHNINSEFNPDFKSSIITSTSISNSNNDYAQYGAGIGG